MKQHWLSDELEECWSLSPDEMQLLKGRTDNSRLVFSLLLKFFQIEGYFPRDHGDVPDAAVKYLGALLNVPPSAFKDYSFSDRLLKSHRSDIRSFLGFRASTNKDAELVKRWLEKKARAERGITHLEECLRQWYLDHLIEQPSPARKTRIINAAIRSEPAGAFEQKITVMMY